MSAFRFALACLCLSLSPLAVATPGQLEPRFGEGGLATVSADFQHSGYEGMDGAVDSSGRSLIAGSVDHPGGTSALLVRLRADGALDTSFGTAGTVKVAGFAGDNRFEFRAVALAADGKIIAAGLSKPDINGLLNARNRVCRFLPSGALDADFGSAGCAAVTFTAASTTDYFTDMEVQADGRIVVSGAAFDGFQRYAVARLNVDGTADTCFGGPILCVGGGAVIEPVSGPTLSFTDRGRIAVDGSGNILLTGRSGASMVVLRLQPDGSADQTFGTQGYRLITPGIVDTSVANAVVALNDNSLFVVGHKNLGDERYAVVAKLSSLGTLDPAFAMVGFREFGFTDVSFDNSALGAVVQADGKVLVVGRTQANIAPESIASMDCAVARLNPNGSFDAGFGFGGVNNFNSGLVDGEFGNTGVADRCPQLSSDGRRAILFGRAGDGGPLSRLLLMAVDLDGLFDDGFE